MTILVEKSAKTLDEGVQNLIEGSKLDYAKWTEKGRAEGSSYYDETLAEFENKWRQRHSCRQCKYR